ENIKLLEAYIEKVNEKDFVDLKESLESELNSYKEIYKILNNATNLFEQKSYKESFKTLLDGEEKYPDNKKLEYALSAYQYSYMLDIASQVVSLAEKEDYDSVVKVLEAAIGVYDCEAFRELMHEAKMKTSLLYATKSKLSDAGSYVFKSAKKMVLGDFSEDEQETLLSLGGSVAASIASVDTPLDVRDFAYDMTHWGEGDYFAARLALDAIGILPVIGALKYIEHLDTVKDIAKTGEKVVDAADAAHDVAKVAEGIIDSGKTIENISDTVDVTVDVKKKTEVVADLTDDCSDYEKKANQVEDTSKAVAKSLDDNGVKFRNGNKLLPDNEFNVNGYKYTTDSNGRLASAEGKLKMCDSSYTRNMEEVRTYEGQDYHKGDHKAHLIGHQFGGSDKLGNLVPMDSKLNQGDYAKLERELAEAVKNGSDVRLKVEPVYKGISNRPAEFKMSYSIDGDKNITVFKN
ncbi:MAG: DNA/RNA non-specific endonuclease, partial [Lachnospiraceae bacterium]|nr:DNA/RNA non-specific endonuclease [Lachnospiraceae bacterium]